MRFATPGGTPAWTDGREQRLALSMLLATLVVTTLLVLLRMPVLPDLMPLTEVFVRLVREEPRDAPRSEPRDDPRAEPEPQREAVDTPAADGRAAEHQPAADAPAAIDWTTASQAAIERYLDALDNPPSVNPVLDAKRRAFEGRYQPPGADRNRPIWENAETDQLGRTVLRSGNCWKVIADPNVTRQYQFREFDQYIVHCAYYKRPPQLLPWVAEIRERYPYLRYPAGYVPDEE
ncbi:MAG: hypothetical protein R3288_00585 [Woeseiaceae bacterium]|nr:hypothetical protein [Woeseiaceae bacterium]